MGEIVTAVTVPVTPASPPAVIEAALKAGLVTVGPPPWPPRWFPPLPPPPAERVRVPDFVEDPDSIPGNSWGWSSTSPPALPEAESGASWLLPLGIGAALVLLTAIVLRRN